MPTAAPVALPQPAQAPEHGASHMHLTDSARGALADSLARLGGAIREGWLPAVLVWLIQAPATEMFAALLPLLGFLYLLDWFAATADREHDPVAGRNGISSKAVCVGVAVAVHTLAHLAQYYGPGGVPAKLGVGLLAAYATAELVSLNKHHQRLKGYPIPGIGPVLAWIGVLQSKLIPLTPAADAPSRNGDA